MSARQLALAALCALSALGAWAQGYPILKRLSPSDVLFMQVEDAIAQGYRAEKGSDAYPDLFFCEWKAVSGEDLFSVAARLSLPYETLATLNGMEHPRSLVAGETLVVPSMAGVFVADQPRNDTEMILAPRKADPDARAQRVTVGLGAKARTFTFYPGSRFYQTERSFFLNIGYRLPIANGRLTSAYGYRSSPIDGHDRFHEGVDLAAPTGTEVVAARAGTVIAVAQNPTLGTYIVIEHDGGWKTVYGHLSSTCVVLNQSVVSGTIIGAVGSTGLSTGPHLHFEIRVSGEARDPSSYVPGLKQ